MLQSPHCNSVSVLRRALRLSRRRTAFDAQEDQLRAVRQSERDFQAVLLHVEPEHIRVWHAGINDPSQMVFALLICIAVHIGEFWTEEPVRL